MAEPDGRLRWRCRRGMRELDQLLLRYLDNCYMLADSEEQRQFIAMLELPDPQLWAFFCGREQPQNPHWCAIVNAITRSS